MTQWYVIEDLNSFTDKLRIMIFNKFGTLEEEDKSSIDYLIDEIAEEDKEELDKILSYQESLNIIKDLARKQTNKKDKEKFRYILDDKIFNNILYSLNDRMVSNILLGLVNKGIVETSYDSEANDFVFWIKNEKDKKYKTD